MQKKYESSIETINAAFQSNDKLAETLKIKKRLKWFQSEVADHIKQLYSLHSIHIFEMICDFDRQLLVEYKAAYENPEDQFGSIVSHIRIQGDFLNREIRLIKLKELNVPGDLIEIFTDMDSIELKY